jgi:LPXTG-motif cell wall-anchored protein
MIVRRSALATFLVFILCCRGSQLEAGNVDYNFNHDDGGWTSLSGWTWSANAKDEKSWKLLAAHPDQKGYYLLSPCFLVTDKTVQFIMNEGHRFNFGDPSEGSKPLGPPPGAGQLQYSTAPENPNSWQGIGLSGGGSWSSLNNDVAPTFNPGTLVDPSPLLASGLAFVGISKDYGKPNNNGVSSQATLPPLQVGAHLQFRFLGDVRDAGFCPNPKLPGPIWDVNKVLIKGVAEDHACPEPSGLALAGAGILLGIGWLMRRRRRRRRDRLKLDERLDRVREGHSESTSAVPEPATHEVRMRGVNPSGEERTQRPSGHEKSRIALPSGSCVTSSRKPSECTLGSATSAPACTSLA